MRDPGEIESQVLVLKRRPLWAEGILLHQHLPVRVAVIRRHFYSHLLCAFLTALLDLVREPGNPLRGIERQHDPLSCVRTGAGPTGTAGPATAVHEMLQRLSG